MQIAQTNLQLYNQLLAQRRSNAEMVRLRRAYELAMRLFSGEYRATGKPFLSHLIGTASLLAWMEQPTDVVIAGLLHAAFDAGDFADGESGVTRTRKDKLAAVVGDQVLALLTEYHRVPRADVVDLVTSRQDLRDLSPLRRQVLLMHVCDTLEEHADGGMNYAPKKNEFFATSLQGDAAANTVAALAQLGYGHYGPTVQTLFDDWSNCQVPAEMITSEPGSYLVPPPSYKRKLKLQFKWRWERVQTGWTRLSRRVVRKRTSALQELAH